MRNYKSQNIELIPSLVGLISVLLAFHYYLSYKWWTGIFKIYNLDSLAILTLEDLTYPLGNINLTVFQLSSVGISLIYLIKLIFPIRDFDNSGKNLSKGLKDARGSFKELSNRNKLISIILISLLLFGYFFIFRESLKFPNTSFEIFYLLIVIILPGCYILSYRKRPLFAIGFVVCVFIWSSLFVNTSLENTKNRKSSTETHISFVYNGVEIDSNDSLSFVFSGYKYLIMKDSSGHHLLFPTKDIGMIRYLKQEKK